MPRGNKKQNGPVRKNDGAGLSVDKNNIDSFFQKKLTEFALKDALLKYKNALHGTETDLENELSDWAKGLGVASSDEQINTVFDKVKIQEEHFNVQFPDTLHRASQDMSKIQNKFSGFAVNCKELAELKEKDYVTAKELNDLAEKFFHQHADYLRESFITEEEIKKTELESLKKSNMTPENGIVYDPKELAESIRKSGFLKTKEDCDRHAQFVISDNVLNDIKNNTAPSDQINGRIADFLKADFNLFDEDSYRNLYTYDAKSKKIVRLKLEKPKEITRESVSGIISQIKERIDSGLEIWNMNSVSESSKGSETLKNCSVLSAKEAKSNTVCEKPEDIQGRPKEPDHPGFWKMFAYRLFGAYKNETAEYRGYQQELKEYNKRNQPNKDIEKAWKTFNKEKLNKICSSKADRERKNSELKTNRSKVKTAAEAFRQKAKIFEGQKAVIDCLSGRRKDIPYPGESNQRLANIPLKQNSRLPQSVTEGLGLLSVNSFRLNENVVDGSSTSLTEFAENDKMTPDEQEFLRKMNAHTKMRNISMKIIPDVFPGNEKDISSRMQSRIGVACEARNALNNALNAYPTNKEPLAALLKDCLPTFYDGVISSGINNYRSCAGIAITKIVNACEQLFANDAELMEKVGFPDEKMNTLRGFAKLTDMLTNRQQKMLENLEKDSGPNTPQRKECLDDILFIHYTEKYFSELSNSQLSEPTKEQKELSDSIYGKLEKPTDSTELEKFKMFFKTSFNSYISPDCPYVIKCINGWGKNPDEMQKFKEGVLNAIHNTEIYKDLVGKSKEELFKNDFDKTAKWLFEELKNTAIGAQKGQKEQTLSRNAEKNVTKSQEEVTNTNKAKGNSVKEAPEIEQEQLNL